MGRPANCFKTVSFFEPDQECPKPEEVAQARIQEYRELYENPYRAAERGYVDDIIMPSEIRKYINAALDLLENKQVARPGRKYSNINL